MDIKTTRPTLTQEAQAALDPKGGAFSGSQSFLSQFVIRTMAGDLKNHPQKEISITAPAATPAPASLVAPPLPKKTEPSTPGIPVPLPPATPLKISGDIKDQAKIIAEEKNKQAREQKSAEETAALQTKEKALAEKQKSAEEKNVRQQKIKDLFEQGELKITAKEFDSAVTDAQKIADDPEANWMEKWRASRLINKAQKAIRQEKLADELRKGSVSATPKISPPMPSASKPVAAPSKTAAAVSFAQITSTQPIKPQPTAAPSAPLDLPIIEETPRPVASAASFTGPAKPAAKEPELFVDIKSEPPKAPTAPSAEKSAAPAPQKSPMPAEKPIPLKMPTGLTPEMFSKKMAETEEETLDIKKVLLVALPSIAILALIVGGIWFLLKGPDQQSPAQFSQTPSPSQTASSPPPVTQTPPAVFRTDSQKIFTLKDGQEKADLEAALLQMTETEEPVGNFIQIIFKDGQGEFVSLSQITSFAGTDFFDLPTQTSAGNLKNQLDLSEASFFAYSQDRNQSSGSPFNASLSNLGRAGLAVTINATSTEELAKSLKDLEQLMLNGLSILLPGNKNNLPANAAFSDATHNGVAVRYVNLPNSELALDYAILDNKLIFATSKESMFAAIDRIFSINGQMNQP